MATTTWTMRGTVGTAVLGLVLALGTGAPARADEAKPGLAATGTMREALTKLGDGRDVELVLTNGKSYRGKLGTVGPEAVLVTNLVGKEFYDVLIDLDEVAAIELRTR
jgi:hypothetical protein